MLSTKIWKRYPTLTDRPKTPASRIAPPIFSCAQDDSHISWLALPGILFRFLAAWTTSREGMWE